MAFTGYLSEFSLPEIFQFLEQGDKSGLLSIQPEPDANKPDIKAHYLWLDRGRIVAVANQLDNEGLLSMIKQRGWLNLQANDLVHGQCTTDQPIGICLKT